MNQLVPILLITLATALLWGAITNRKPFEALKELLRGNNPNNAPPINSDGSTPQFPLPSKRKVPNMVDGFPVSGIFVPDKLDNKGRKAWYPVSNTSVYGYPKWTHIGVITGSGDNAEMYTESDSGGFTVFTGQLIPISQLD